MSSDVLNALFAKANATQKPTSAVPTSLDVLFGRVPQPTAIDLLRIADSQANSILYEERDVTLCKYDVNTGKCRSSKKVGTFYIYEKKEGNTYCVLLKISSPQDTLVIPLEQGVKVQFLVSNLVIHSKDGSHGFSFKDNSCAKPFELIASLLQKVSKSNQCSRKNDLLTFLNKTTSKSSSTLPNLEATSFQANVRENKPNKLKACKPMVIETKVVDMSQKNLKCIRTIDPLAKALLAQCSHAALYKYDVENERWEKTEVGGPFFVYSRKDKPRFSYMIANRQAMDDFIQPVLPEMRFEANPPYIFTNIPGEDISALWFGDESECTSVYTALKEVKEMIEKGGCDDDELKPIDLSQLIGSGSQPETSTAQTPQRPTFMLSKNEDEVDKCSSDEDSESEHEDHVVPLKDNEKDDKQGSTPVLEDLLAALQPNPSITQPSNAQKDSTESRCLKYVKSVDPIANQLLGYFKQVAVYTLDTEKKQWVPAGIDGPLFIYSRLARPQNSLIIANKRHSKDFVRPITEQTTVAIKPPFMFINTPDTPVSSLFFPKHSNCHDAFALINKICTSKNQSETSKVERHHNTATKPLLSVDSN